MDLERAANQRRTRRWFLGMTGAAAGAAGLAAVRCSGGECAQIELPGVPLGSFSGSTYDEITFALHGGDLFVFCTDGVFEAMDEKGQEFSTERLIEVVRGAREQPPARLVETIFAAVAEWRGDAPQNDDMTAVAVRITT